MVGDGCGLEDETGNYHKRECLKSTYLSLRFETVVERGRLDSDKQPTAGGSAQIQQKGVPPLVEANLLN